MIPEIDIFLELMPNTIGVMKALTNYQAVGVTEALTNPYTIRVTKTLTNIKQFTFGAY